MKKEIEPEVEPDQGDNDDFEGKSPEKQFVGKVPGMKSRKRKPKKVGVKPPSSGKKA